MYIWKLRGQMQPDGNSSLRPGRLMQPNPNQNQADRGGKNHGRPRSSAVPSRCAPYIKIYPSLRAVLSPKALALAPPPSPPLDHHLKGWSSPLGARGASSRPWRWLDACFSPSPPSVPAWKYARAVLGFAAVWFLSNSYGFCPVFVCSSTSPTRPPGARRSSRSMTIRSCECSHSSSLFLAQPP